MTTFIKRLLPHILAISFLVGADLVYFAPQVLDGEKVEAGDAISSTAWSKQVIEHAEETGERVNWNPSMFSGMPWGLLSYGVYNNLVLPVNKILHLGIKYPAGLFIKVSLICYLSLVLLGIGPWISLLGALVFTFNVNYTVLIEAGHQSKLEVIATFPAIVAAFILAFRRKFLIAASLLSISISLALLGNHIQMVYYLMLCMILMGIAYVVWCIMEKKTELLLKASGVLIFAALLGAASSFTQLYSSKKFSEDTMRGKPILEKEVEQQGSSSGVEGLAWDYAMNWSNGATDLLSFYIPTIVGGSSAEEVPQASPAGRLLKQNGYPTGKDGNVNGAPMYWGPLPFTSGPYYVGVPILILALASLFFLSGKLRWGVIASGILILLISMGKNAEWLNRLLYDNLPLFNKFRSPNSAVNILPVFLVIPAAIGLDKILHKKESLTFVLFGRSINPFILVSSILAGISLFYWGAGDGFLALTTDRELGVYQNNPTVLNMFKETRAMLLERDAMRTFLLALLCMAAFWAYSKQYLPKKYLLPILLVISLLDLWTLDRRYLDDDNFVERRAYDSNFTPRAVDQTIFSREPNGRGYYRVLDFSINTFNSAQTSYHHNTIGGYHAAKLQRYQDLIDYHISQGNQQVLNMLNSKYIIDQNQRLQVNNQALGNAWFINQLIEVNSPLEEIESLSDINTATQAVVLQSDFADQLAGIQPGDGSGTISLVNYAVDELTYEYQTNSKQIAVFSEIWYPGWQIYIDGEPVEMFRVNYVLRALAVPAGQHTIKFVFQPRAPGKWLTLLSSLGILLLCGITIGYYVRRKPWQLEPEPSADSSKSAGKKGKAKSARKKKSDKKK